LEHRENDYHSRWDALCTSLIDPWVAQLRLLAIYVLNRAFINSLHLDGLLPKSCLLADINCNIQQKGVRLSHVVCLAILITKVVRPCADGISHLVQRFNAMSTAIHNKSGASGSPHGQANNVAVAAQDRMPF
jgi:hypothetical protein